MAGRNWGYQFLIKWFFHMPDSSVAKMCVWKQMWSVEIFLTHEVIRKLCDLSFWFHLTASSISGCPYSIHLTYFKKNLNMYIFVLVCIYLYWISSLPSCSLNCFSHVIQFLFKKDGMKLDHEFYKSHFQPSQSLGLPQIGKKFCIE